MEIVSGCGARRQCGGRSNLPEHTLVMSTDSHNPPETYTCMHLAPARFELASKPLTNRLDTHRLRSAQRGKQRVNG
eukprot:9469785-Pyramimonas_sp.AAC.1